MERVILNKYVDAMFLTKFIRMCKFSLESAKKKLDSMLTIRSNVYFSPFEFRMSFYYFLLFFPKAALPEFVNNWDPTGFSIQAALNCGYF